MKRAFYLDREREDLVAMLQQAERSLQGCFAAACAERVLHYTNDSRAKAAIAAARAWAEGRLRVGPARIAAIAAHAAAREAPTPAAMFACRAAGHAAATAHMAGHAIGPCDYAIKALAAASGDPEKARVAERAWQLARLVEMMPATR